MKSVRAPSRSVSINVEAARNVVQWVSDASAGYPMTENDHIERDWIFVSGKATTTRKESARQIIARVASQYGVTVEDVVGPSRLPQFVEARHHAMREIRANTKLSSPQIGRLFNRDHTTVLHALGTTSRARSGDMKARAA